MTALEVYQLTTQGGATDFARLIRACESFGSYCLIGGLAVNCYVEPVYTLDANIVLERRFVLDGLACKAEVGGRREHEKFYFSPLLEGESRATAP